MTSYPEPLASQPQPSDRFLAALRAWGPTAEAMESLSGARNEVWEIRLGGRRYAGRLSNRDPASLAWELDLLAHLDTAGLRVPTPIPSCDGRRQVDGLALLSWLDGDPLSSSDDWRSVADALRRLHSVTTAWPQRPGFHTVSELVHLESSGDARLDRMPPDLVQRLRAAWADLKDETLSVVHGDPGVGNVRMQRGRVGLLDWDEARVDTSLLDFGAIAPCLSSFTDVNRLRRGRRAAMAWEVANAWIVEPEYARGCVQELEDADQQC